jgi:hypothetical protein
VVDLRQSFLGIPNKELAISTDFSIPVSVMRNHGLVLKEMPLSSDLSNTNSN